jgi:hypothetical protein
MKESFKEMILMEFGRAVLGDWDAGEDFISAISQEAIDKKYTRVSYLDIPNTLRGHD